MQQLSLETIAAPFGAAIVRQSWMVSDECNLLHEILRLHAFKASGLPLRRPGRLPALPDPGNVPEVEKLRLRDPPLHGAFGVHAKPSMSMHPRRPVVKHLRPAD